jgi:acyl-coenzyme A thioesterase PaaI-like protein
MSEQIETQRTCFACGQENPQGLGLRFHIEAQGVVTAEWVPDSRWEGFRGIIHGGIVSTVLDEAMSKAVASAGTPGLTCQLEVRLRHSVTPAERLRIRAWVTEKRKRRVRVEADIRDTADAEKAHATATFLVPHSGSRPER